MSVTCILYGGLGNQLFQIFATISYSIKHNIDFQFKYNQNLGKRQTYWHSLLSTIIDHTTTDPVVSTQIVNQGSHGFVNLDAPLPNQNVQLNGYFQSYLFFDDHLKTILKMINVEKPQDRIKQQIPQNCVSLHFRRGDYKGLQECHPILDIQYYVNALTYISIMDESIANVHYYCEEEDIDEIEKVVENLKKEFRKFIFVRHLEETDWEEMLSMSCCKHNIIANSSFSWWGAYFNTNPNKIVCYPSVWFGPLISENTDSMFPENWIKM